MASGVATLLLPVRLKLGAQALEVEVVLTLGGLADFRSCDLPFFNPVEGFKEPLSLFSPLILWAF